MINGIPPNSKKERKIINIDGWDGINDTFVIVIVVLSLRSYHSQRCTSSEEQEGIIKASGVCVHLSNSETIIGFILISILNEENDTNKYVSHIYY